MMIRFCTRRQARFFNVISTKFFRRPRYNHSDAAKIEPFISTPSLALDIRDDSLSVRYPPSIGWFDEFDQTSIVSNESTSSNENSFLDQLLRSSFTGRSSNVAVPTVVDSSELGGLSDSGAIENIEFFDDELVNIADLSISESLNDCSRQLTPPSTSKSNEYGRRQKHTLFLPNSYEVNVGCGLGTVQNLNAERSVMPIPFLMDALKSEDIESLVKLAGEYQWPRTSELKNKTNLVLNFIVRNGRTPQESRLLLSDFYEHNSRSHVPPAIILQLIHRYILETNLSATMQFISCLQNEFLLQQSSNFSARFLSPIYEVAFGTEDLSGACALHEALLKHGLSRNSHAFLRSASLYLVQSKNGFSNVFIEWCKLSTKYGSTSGIGNIFDCALTAGVSTAEFGKRLGKILHHCRSFDHPYVIVAELICALIRNGKIEEAGSVLSQVTVSGRYFSSCLSQFSELKHIEDCAGLIGRLVYGERAGAGRKKANDSNSLSSSSQNVDNMLNVLSEFYGKTHASKQRYGRSFQKQETKNYHRANERELNDLADLVVKRWISMALFHSDRSAATKIVSWAKAVRFIIPPELERRLSVLSSK